MGLGPFFLFLFFFLDLSVEGSLGEKKKKRGGWGGSECIYPPGRARSALRSRSGPSPALGAAIIVRAGM